MYFLRYCVEACPTDAITHGHGFELATFNASNLVYRKEQMLAARPAHMGANVVFNQADVDGGAPKRWLRELEFSSSYQTRRSLGAGVCAWWYLVPSS